MRQFIRDRGDKSRRPLPRAAELPIHLRECGAHLARTLHSRVDFDRAWALPISSFGNRRGKGIGGFLASGEHELDNGTAHARRSRIRELTETRPDSAARDLLCHASGASGKKLMN